MKNVTIAIALALGVASNPAFAEGSQNKELVTYEDLDLTKEAGRATLDRRLNQAINKVCQTSWSRSVRIATETRQCIADLREEIAPTRDAIIAKAQSQTNRSALATSR